MNLSFVIVLSRQSAASKHRHEEQDLRDMVRHVMMLSLDRAYVDSEIVPTCQ